MGLTSLTRMCTYPCIFEIINKRSYFIIILVKLRFELSFKDYVVLWNIQVSAASFLKLRTKSKTSNESYAVIDDPKKVSYCK